MNNFSFNLYLDHSGTAVIFSEVKSTNNKKKKNKKNRGSNGMRHRNKEHDHRVNKQNGDIKMKTDKKQNERIQINRIKC